MKKLIIFTAIIRLFCCTVVFAEEPVKDQLFDWNLLWSGQWNGKSLTDGNLHNRGEIKFLFLPLGLTLRGQILDRRPFTFDIEPEKNWFEAQNFDKAVTHFQGGLYHKETDSKLLYGVLDEQGLSARIRNPWIRSPPYAENHVPITADLKTAASSTKNDEAYMFLSTPSSKKISGFISAQTELDKDIDTQYRQTAVAAGLEFDLPKNSWLSLETFYTWALLKPKKSSSWFSDPPALPERDFKLYAAGIIFENPFFSISSDYALSETFAWSPCDIYANLGISFSPAKPLTISLAADGSGKRFVNRDGSNLNPAFRTAAKIEVKKPSNSLIKFSTVLRSPNTITDVFTNGEGFTRSQTNFYYRFPAAKKNDARLIRLARISVTADRNADNHENIIDRLHGYIGFSLNLSEIGLNNPIGIYLNGSVRGITTAETFVVPYPIPVQPWNFENSSVYGELTYSPSPYQFKAMLGYSNSTKNDGIWDCSFSGAVRIKKGRVNLKIVSPKLPDIWNLNISYLINIL